LGQSIGPILKGEQSSTYKLTAGLFPVDLFPEEIELSLQYLKYTCWRLRMVALPATLFPGASCDDVSR
jgi:hypothetical protein